jgi:hypothetical protein
MTIRQQIKIMDPNSIKDRNTFFRNLIINPVFLLRNIGSLSVKIYGYIYNKLKIQLTSKHRGLKSTPRWMINIKTADRSTNYKLLSRFFLPAYPAANGTNSASLLEHETGLRDHQNDPEAYFNENRWGFLVESIFVEYRHFSHNQTKVLNWIQLHSDKEDDAWEVYSACERVSNLLVYLAVTGSTSIPPEFQNIAIDFVADSIVWIYKNLEYYGAHSTNNHILNNARALIIGGAAIGDEKYCQAGLQIYRHYLPLMIGANGFLRERSSHYQLIVNNWILDAWQFAAMHYGTHHSDTKYLEDYIQRMAAATSMLCGSNRRLLGLIGDISPDTSPNRTYLRLSRLYLTYFPLSKVSDPFSEIRDDWFRLSAADHHVLGNFPDGTYPPKFPIHGHSDYTSFVWTYDSIEVLVDMGRYRYTPDSVSLFQKSPLGHNVLLVDGFSPVCESLVVNGQWWPRSYATANLVSWLSSGAVHLSHDGFARATNVLRHTRTITLGENGLEVVDSLEGSGDAMIQLRWNFGNSFDAFDTDLLAVRGGGSMVLFSTTGFAKTPLVESCSTKLSRGWISTAYGDVAPSISVDVSGSVKLPAVISTRFQAIKCAG